MANIDERIEFINAGFDYPNSDAIVVIVGITPGNNQLENGYENQDVKIISKEESFERKKKYAFKGLRKNIEQMLDYVGVNKVLNIEKCETIWNEDFAKVDFTSLIKEAAFEVKGESKIPFNDTDIIEKSVKLKEKYQNGFVNDCKLYSKVKLFVACGHKVYNVLCKLKSEGIITASIISIAHPSNNNTIRVLAYQGIEEKSLKECKDDAMEAKTVVNELLINKEL